MIKPTYQTVTAVLVLAGALLFDLGGLGIASATPGVRQAGPETLQLVDAGGQVQTAWTVESTIQDVLQIDTTLYVACGPRGVLIFDLAAPDKPALVGRLAEGSNVVKLAQNGKSLLVVIADFSARTFSLANPQKPQPEPLAAPFGGSLTVPAGSRPAAPDREPSAAASEPSAHATPYPPPLTRAPRPSWARVTAVRGGWVAVTTTGTVQVGDRFMVHSQRRVRVSDPTLTRQLYAPSNEPTGMFVVTRVSGNLASGALPRGTVVHVGDLAEPTLEYLHVPKVAPPLWYGMGRFYGTLRPSIGIASSSTQYYDAPFGMLNDFTLEYYLPVPIKLGVQVQPLGLVLGSRAGLTTEIRAMLSFASSYFEIGLEPGGVLHLHEASRFVIGYMVRLGSLDGLNLSLHNSYTVDPRASGDPLSFSSLSLEINIPLASRFNLFLSGGGSQRWAYGTVGLKYYARGGGGPGTLVVSSGAGGAWVSDRCNVDPNSTNTAVCQQSAIQTLGPMLSVGLDARF